MFRMLHLSDVPEMACPVSPRDHIALHAIADGIVPTCRIGEPVLAPQPETRQPQSADSWQPVGHNLWERRRGDKGSGCAGYAVPLDEGEWPQLGHRPVAGRMVPCNRSSSSSGPQPSETPEEVYLRNQFNEMVLEGAQDKVKALPPSLQAQARTQALRAPPEKAITEGMKEFAARNLVGKPAGKRNVVEFLPTIEECGPLAKQQKAASS